MVLSFLLIGIMSVLDWIKRFSSQRSLAKVVRAVEQNLYRHRRTARVS